MLDRGFTKEGILYRHAVPEDAEQLARLYDAVYEGGYSLKECLDPSLCEERIRKREHIWMVALDKDKVVSATVSRPEAWNRSYETCRSVTLKEYLGRKIGTNLYDIALHAALSKEDCDLAYGYPRTEGMKRLMEKPNPPITIVGSDFGMHIVSGKREVHLWSIIYNPFRKIIRV